MNHDETKRLDLTKKKKFKRMELLEHLLEGYTINQIMDKTNYSYATVAMYRSRFRAGGLTTDIMDAIIDRMGFDKIEKEPHFKLR